MQRPLVWARTERQDKAKTKDNSVEIQQTFVEPHLPHLEIYEGTMTRMRVRKVHKGSEVKSSNSYHLRFDLVVQ